MNSLKHGLCSKQVVLPGEDPAAFERLTADYARRFRPVGPAEQELVEIIANSSWRLKRIIRIETAILSDEASDPIKGLSLLIRYENQLNRTYDLSMKRLKELQEKRPAAAPDPKPAAVRNEPRPVISTADRDLDHAIFEALRAPAPRQTEFNPTQKHPGRG